MRDSQRSRVYASDRGLWDWAKANDALVRFPTRWEIEKYVKRVHDWASAGKNVVAFLGAGVPTVEQTRRGVSSKGNQYKWKITMNVADKEWHFTNVIVLHELAHLYGPRGEKHGPGFAKMYLTLVREFMGEAAAAELERQFKMRRVKYRVMKKRARRVLTAEQKRELTKRLALARATKEAKAVLPPDAFEQWKQEAAAATRPA